MSDYQTIDGMLEFNAKLSLHQRQQAIQAMNQCFDWDGDGLTSTTPFKTTMFGYLARATFQDELQTEIHDLQAHPTPAWQQLNQIAQTVPWLCQVSYTSLADQDVLNQLDFDDEQDEELDALIYHTGIFRWSSRKHHLIFQEL